MKGIFIVLDGVADEACSSLNGRTPLEAAKTPNLDSFARKGKLDYCYPIKEGLAPQSASAIISLFGYDPSGVPRGALEAAGAGIDIHQGDLVMRTNFATIDSLDNKEIIDPRAGRTLSTREAQILAKAINDKIRLPFPVEFHSTIGHRGVLIFRGGFSDNINDVDPFYGPGMATESLGNKFRFSKPLDDEDDSKLSADLVNMFVRHSHQILSEHEINIERKKKGLYPANFLLCRGVGNRTVRFKKLKGKWIALGYMPLEIGIAKACGMGVYRFRYPKLKGIDSYKNLYEGLEKAIRNSIKMLKKHRKKYDYFYIHLKETDTVGHDGNAKDKMKMIEMIDAGLFGFLKRFLKDRKTNVLVTADHTTSCRKKAHTEKPVPVLTWPHEKGGDRRQRFTEKYGLKGKKIVGRRLLGDGLF
tara:strand:+ start:1711 stop:2958 length:1248 start_codon:yes stop_codon:yes gene_type:complete